MARNIQLTTHSDLYARTLVSLAMAAMLGCEPSTPNDRKESPPPSEKGAKLEVPKKSIDSSIDLEGLMAARLSSEELDFGWIRLFDGQSLMGWKPSSKANWRVEEGTIAVDAGEKGFLFTTSRFGDFELQLEFLAEPATNSGVFLRCPLAPTNPGKDCYELNIAPVDNPFPTGSLVERIKANGESVGELDMTEWHTLHALVDGSHIQIWVDGRNAVDYQDETDLRSGYIGLQFREGRIRFRDIRLRPINYTVLPSKSLDDWKAATGEGFEGKLDENGSLVLRGGKGYMELMQTLGDFCVQARVKTLASKVNSGLFVRCIPGESMNGYECQIHHGYEGDRRLPVDGGMGAIFRRQDARAVLSDEDQTAHVTLVADGPHFASWVEGVQVVDWTDTREANENPRKGLRLEAGTLQLQSHDSSCEVRFDSLEISPIP